MNTSRILVAGASGMLGTQIVRTAAERGHHVRALTRSGTLVPHVHDYVRGDLMVPSSLRDAVLGIDTVISCAGSSMSMSRWGERRSFRSVDTAGNIALIDAARNAGVKKFVYVSVAGAAALRRTEYCDAHLRVEEYLVASSMEFTIVRPTGFFGFLLPMLDMARSGRGVVIGEGSARTNPVDERDVADACVRSVTTDDHFVDAGGPEILTRREIVEIAFRCAGRTPRIRTVAPGVMRTAIAPMRLLQPRIHALLDFGIAVSTADSVAVGFGRRRLEEYFRDHLSKEK